MDHDYIAVGPLLPLRLLVAKAVNPPRSNPIDGFGLSLRVDKQRMPAVPVSLNIPFLLSVAGAFLTSAVVAATYVWPALRTWPRHEALRLLAAFRAFRFLGMNFMVTGFVSPEVNRCSPARSAGAI